MILSIEYLLKTLEHEDHQEQKSLLTQMILESLALQKDNEIMSELMLEMIKRNSALNVQLESKLEEIRLLSVTDQLTGLFNRRKFLEVLHNEIIRSKRYTSSFSIIMFDIDHFKHVNDNYGHDVGDYVLKEMSYLTKTHLRDTDTIARWGGEEFMILVPESDIELAFTLADKIRQLIEDFDFSPVQKVTSSFGVISCEKEEHANVSYLTKAVDLALYESKESGRNTVTRAVHSL